MNCREAEAVSAGASGAGDADNTLTTSSQQQRDLHDLSCWESWLVQKAKEERQRVKREARLKRREQQQQRHQQQVRAVMLKGREQQRNVNFFLFPSPIDQISLLRFLPHHFFTRLA